MVSGKDQSPVQSTHSKAVLQGRASEPCLQGVRWSVGRGPETRCGKVG